jgi:hypothetical protein
MVRAKYKADQELFISSMQNGKEKRFKEDMLIILDRLLMDFIGDVLKESEAKR